MLMHEESWNLLSGVSHERGLILKFAKCWLGFRKVNFFGYEVSYVKYQLTQERIDEVCSMPMPTSQKMMQRFLGAALFFKGFIPNYSTVAAPLHDMCKSKFNWEAGREIMSRTSNK